MLCTEVRFLFRMNSSLNKRNTSYTFIFLKASTPEEETYDLLEKVADGEKTIANLNKVR